MITSWAPMPFMRSNSPSPSRSSVPSTCSAGNLFGTTRSSHPGVLGAPPSWRYERISGGVIASRPGQNGHSSRAMIAARSKRKSFGRFCRSVEMITQRPVTGSLRSSGFECVLNDLDDRLARVELYRDDVEPARTGGQAMSHHVVARELRDPAALEAGDRFGRLTERAAIARLHLDKYQRRPVSRDDVQFSTALAVAPGNNCVAAALELA